MEEIIYLKMNSPKIREKISIIKLIIWKMRIRAYKDQGIGKDVFFSYYKIFYNKLSSCMFAEGDSHSPPTVAGNNTL